MAKKRGKTSEYELVPEKRFLKLENSLKRLSKNPVLKVKNSDKFAQNIELLHDSIISLLEVLKSIKDDAEFADEDTAQFKKDIKPLVTAVHDIKDQNETIANGMINIIDRLNDFQKQMDTLKEYVLPIPQNDPNPQLPPLSGGPFPPSENPVPLYTNAIPPLEMGSLKK